MIRIAIVASNYDRVSDTTKKGAEILLHILLTELHAISEHSGDLAISVFGSGDSTVPFPLTSITPTATSTDKRYRPNDQKLWELALVSKALSKHNEFDLYHTHITNGEYILPFAPLVPKPILITMHGPIDGELPKKYFELFQKLSNVWFVSISESQRRQMPALHFAATIHNGIELSTFQFDPDGGKAMMWAGRAVPEKGANIVLRVMAKTHRGGNLFPILKPEWQEWFLHKVAKKADLLSDTIERGITINLTRKELIKRYQKSKLFLFPISWEEPFGLVMTESMACGTPIVAYARGSAPELIVDGKTGFLVNANPHDRRGTWIVKKTGINGLVEAVERIYAMSDSEYLMLRKNCRSHMEKHFSSTQMASKYLAVYKKLLTQESSRKLFRSFRPSAPP